MGDNIIGKSFDKLVKARDVKVSTKRWRDGSQTQRYGGSGKGYTKVGHIGSDNGMSPDRHQAIIWTNDGILLIRTLGTNFSELLGKIRTFSFK